MGRGGGVPKNEQGQTKGGVESKPRDLEGTYFYFKLFYHTSTLFLPIKNSTLKSFHSNWNKSIV